ncbi:MAG: hypothetical protein JNJ78_10040 [Anaerolineae bacterium]|nr:hypothetical protein [Anaerolineae bacterium]
MRTLISIYVFLTGVIGLALGLLQPLRQWFPSDTTAAIIAAIIALPAGLIAYLSLKHWINTTFAASESYHIELTPSTPAVQGAAKPPKNVTSTRTVAIPLSGINPLSWLTYIWVFFWNPRSIVTSLWSNNSEMEKFNIWIGTTLVWLPLLIAGLGFARLGSTYNLMSTGLVALVPFTWILSVWLDYKSQAEDKTLPTITYLSYAITFIVAGLIAGYSADSYLRLFSIHHGVEQGNTAYDITTTNLIGFALIQLPLILTIAIGIPISSRAGTQHITFGLYTWLSLVCLGAFALGVGLSPISGDESFGRVHFDSFVHFRNPILFAAAVVAYIVLFYATISIRRNFDHSDVHQFTEPGIITFFIFLAAYIMLIWISFFDGWRVLANL